MISHKEARPLSVWISVHCGFLYIVCQGVVRTSGRPDVTRHHCSPKCRSELPFTLQPLYPTCLHRWTGRNTKDAWDLDRVRSSHVTTGVQGNWDTSHGDTYCTHGPLAAPVQRQLLQTFGAEDKHSCLSVPCTLSGEC